ncbi:hypothetical protein C3E95_28430, partial [Klebsiella pneumoniae]
PPAVFIDRAVTRPRIDDVAKDKMVNGQAGAYMTGKRLQPYLSIVPSPGRASMTWRKTRWSTDRLGHT